MDEGSGGKAHGHGANGGGVHRERIEEGSTTDQILCKNVMFESVR